MCTVSYLPLQNGYILTSNRDEWNKRPSALKPMKYTVFGQDITFPKDQLANGTWIAMANSFTLCLLNGAFIKHIPNPPYRLSRGIMLLDFFRFLNVDKFILEYDFKGIDNFTLLIKSNTNEEFDEIRWDGVKIHRTKLNSKEKYIWSSCTLYDDETILERKMWFKNWIINHSIYTQDDIVDFHQFAGTGDSKNDVVMKRSNGVQTLSISSISKHGDVLEMKYIDLS